MRWFFPGWTLWRKHIGFFVFMTILPLTGYGGAKPFALSRVAFFAFFAVMVFAYLTIKHLVRVSPIGLHPLREEVIPWSSITAAARRGMHVKFLAAIGEQGIVKRELHVRDGLAAALAEWLPATHPIRSALAGPEARFGNAVETAWPIADGTLLRAPRAVTWAAVAGFVLFGGMLAASILVFEGLLGMLFTVFFASFVLLSVYSFVGSLAAYYVIEERQLRARDLRHVVTLAWDDVATIDYWPRLMSFVLRSARGRRVFVGSVVDGMPLLARALLQRCPGATITPRARRLLQDCADGFQPTELQQEPTW